MDSGESIKDQRDLSRATRDIVGRIVWIHDCQTNTAIGLIDGTSQRGPVMGLLLSVLVDYCFSW